MKNTFAHTVRAFSLIAATACLAACSKSPDTETDPVKTVRIRLQVQESVIVKSQPQVSEALVADLNLFIYDSKDNLTDAVYVKNPGKKTSVEINAGEDFSIYAIANVGDITSMEYIGTSSGLSDAAWRLDTPSDIAGQDGQIPMSGKTGSMNLQDGGDITITLTRMLARLRLIADTTGLSDDVETFDITRVRIMNTNREIKFFKPSGADSEDDIFRTGVSVSGERLKDLYSSGLDFYIPENILGSHVPPADYDGLCTYVELTVKYKSREHYGDSIRYRYYLHEGVNQKDFSVRRNVMYTCHTIFNGSGLEENSWRVDLSGMKDFVTRIVINPDVVRLMNIGESILLTSEVYPASAENRTLAWSSDNEGVAVVSPNGTLVSTGIGACTITASATDGSGIKAYCDVEVNFESFFTMKDIPDILYPGYNTPYTLEYELYPLTSPSFSIECISGDENCITESDGILYAHNPDNKQGEIGSFTITGKANGITITDNFTVSGGEVVLNKLFNNIFLGITTRLGFDRLMPPDADLSWSTNDPTMVSISEDGSITPLKTGKCTIKVQSETGASDIINIKINEPYLTFIDVTMFEGGTWELTSDIRPVPASLPIEYSVVKGKEYVSISGNQMYGIKRTDGFDDVTIMARLVDYPHIYTTAKVCVIPAVTATLSGDNRVVNTYGHSSDGSSWSNFRNTLQMDVFHTENIPQMTWEVRDGDGNISSDISVSEDGLINPYSPTANGKYTIVGWDDRHRFCTEPVEIEVYRLLEYECGLGEYSLVPLGNTNVYSVSLIARWSKDSWNILSGYEQNLLMQQNLLTYPSFSRIYHNIGSYDNGESYIENYITSIKYTGNPNVTSALSPLKPLSYMRRSLTYRSGNETGINGVYYRFTPEQNNGLDGYYYIRQKNEVFYNSGDFYN